jgi:adenosylcobinamide kinase/adenosylcobinamide-phosphate guanylyltransferase
VRQASFDAAQDERHPFVLSDVDVRTDAALAAPRWRRVLVLGGARSGKSAFAEQVAAECGEPVLYVATATAADAEMAERVAHHRAQRPAAWRTLEVPLGLAQAVADARGEARTVLVEDLTLLLANLLEDGADAEAAERAAGDDVEALLRLDAHVVLVSNEVGMGLVPPYPLGRLFRDALGRLNQHAAARAGEVYLIVAGLPLRLK